MTHTKTTVAIAASLSATLLLSACAPKPPEGGGAAKGGKAPAAAPGGGKPQGPPPTAVVVQTVAAIKDKQQVKLLGSLRAPDRIPVKARTNGQIVVFSLKEGDRVSAGQVIARLDGQDQTLTVRLAKAAVEQQKQVIRSMRLGQRDDRIQQYTARKRALEASLDQAQDEMDRLEPLVIKGFAPKQDLVSAELQRERIIAQMQEVDALIAESKLGQRQEDIATQQTLLKIRETELDRAKLGLDRTVVKAPVSGVVQAKLASLGQLVDTGTALVEIVPIKDLDAELLLPEAYGSRVRVGDRVSLTFPAISPKTYFGVVEGIPASAEAGSRNKVLRVSPSALPTGALPGIEVRGVLALGTAAEGFAFNRDALVMFEGKNMVFVAKDGKASPRPVEIAIDRGDLFLAKGPFSPGDQVIVVGNEMLMPNAPVSVVKVEESFKLRDGGL